ncbi:GPW/gp25 family protein [Photobacterium leiognathi]|uniref:GPW/gp25 family protein n=1 Tax=Photobacterium leiognathi TaxID=553611 RepID=UPI002739E0D4|nr:GPW/gp25 family protein [Photobacterium leiognathi]
MNGTDAATGRSLSGDDHLLQSIRDILTTQLGTRVMRPRYGSNVPRLVDNPFNATTRADIIAESAVALERWEPRLDVTRITVTQTQAGVVVARIEGFNRETGQQYNTEEIPL